MVLIVTAVTFISLNLYFRHDCRSSTIHSLCESDLWSARSAQTDADTWR